MATIVKLCRDMVLKVGDGKETEAFNAIAEITSLTLTSGSDDVDLTNFDTDGFKTAMPILRSLGITFEANYVVDATSGDVDADTIGRLVTLSREVGYDAIGNFELTLADGEEMSFSAGVKVGDLGGGVGDKMLFKCELVISGKPTFA